MAQALWMSMSQLLSSVLVLIFLSTAAYAAVEPIGNVVQHEGVASVDRQNEELNLEKNSDIMFRDNVRTGKGSVGITFIDDTNVAISAQSSLVIDEFVYDPNSQSGSKLVLNVALGTVRYASGNIAKLDNQNVDIRTPTARIGVRGTAFSMTVDEIGKSLIILLPNADGTVGEIFVETDAGMVIMNKAFQATTVGVAESNPSKPVILDLTLDQINNMLIVRPPKEKLIELVKDSKKLANLLDIDLLDYKELDENELEEDNLEYGLLDINPLDVDLLLNILTQLNKKYETKKTKKKGKGIHTDGQTSGKNPDTLVTTVIEGNETHIIRQVDGNNIYLILDNSNGYSIDINQGGVEVPEIRTDEAGYNSTITIIQHQ